MLQLIAPRSAPTSNGLYSAANWRSTISRLSTSRPARCRVSRPWFVGIIRPAADSAVWQRTQGREFTIAVNMSARQLQDPGLIAKIQAALAASGISANALILEITESATVEDTERSIEVLNSLKTLGVRLAIDDFGTGYSSLSYLRRFPVDQLKVDQSFVSELVTNPEDLAIVSSVINLGHSLGLSVVAEGVETVDQLEKLCDMGCDQAQGFKWRRPADAQDVSSWLDSLAGEAALA